MDTDNISLTLDDTALAPFRAAWRRAVEQQRDRDGDALLSAVQERVRTLDGALLPGFVRDRLALVPDMLALLRDREWNAGAEVRSDLNGALAYLSDPFDLIPDDQRYGLLDDALVLELALASHRGEWLAWREYASFRSRHCEQGQSLVREDWMGLRRRLQRDGSRSPRTGYPGPGARTPFQRERHSYVATALRPQKELFEVH